MEKHAAATASTPKPLPQPDPLDFCQTCGKPIDVTVTAWISLAGVLFGADCGTCR